MARPIRVVALVVSGGLWSSMNALHASRNKFQLKFQLMFVAASALRVKYYAYAMQYTHKTFN